MPAGGPGRRRRPPGIPLVEMKNRVPEGTRARANVAADALGITLAHYIELLVQRDAFDDTGRPLWADEVFGPSPDPLPEMGRTNAA